MIQTEVLRRALDAAAEVDKAKELGFKNGTLVSILVTVFAYLTINNYSMKQPDLYYFETIKITPQA